MRFGVVLPTHCYNHQRFVWAVAAFQSLAKTIRPVAQPVLLIIEHPDSLMRKSPHLLYNPPVFSIHIVEQPVEIGGTEQTLAWGTEKLFMQHDVCHCVWMGDDALFHPNWLVELESLVLRHPDAKAWSVYRSAHVRHHATIRFDEHDDVLVKSLCGHGMTFTRKEWTEWGILWTQGQRWPVPSGGNTLDLHHAYHRPGERWCTKKSYVEHTGTIGVNVAPGIPEHAQEFVGVGD